MAPPNTVEIRVTATATDAQKVLDAIATAGGRVGKIVAAGGNEAEKALDGLGGTARRVFEIFTGVNLAAVFQQGVAGLKEFIAESSRLGREQQLQEATFKSFATSVGVAGDVLAAQIEAAAGGIIDSGDAMKIAMRGLASGLQPEQIVTLTDAARQLAKSLGVDAVEAYQSLTEAIATGRSRRLEAVNITIDSEAALKAYAASLGKSVEELTVAGKAQALFSAVMTAAGPVIESNRKVNDEFGESMQRLKVAWQDVKETVGAFINDTALKVLAWFSDVGKRIPDTTSALQQMGSIWSGVWSNIKDAVAGLGDNLVSVIIPALKLALAAAAAFGVGLNAAFAATAGPVAFLSSAIGDLADKKWPDFKRATLEANVATAEARVRLAESVEGFDRLRQGTTATSAATKEMAAATGAGTNRLGELSNQVKPLIPDMKALAAATKSAQDAMGGIAAVLTALATAPNILLPKDLGAEALKPLLLAIDQARGKLVDLRDTMDPAEFKLRLAAFDEGTESLKKYGAGLVQITLDTKAALDESTAFYEGLKEQIDSARLSVEAMEFSYEKWLATLNADGALDEARAFYQGLAENISSAAQSVESVQTPLDDAARSSLAFEETLAGIRREAALLGPDFDEAGRFVSALTSRILELQAIKNPTGDLLADIERLKGELSDTRAYVEFRDMWRGAFAAVGNAIDTLIQGWILGTQTMAQAWDKLWKSIAVSIINSGAQRLIKGLGDTLWDALFGAFRAGSSATRPTAGGSSPYDDPRLVDEPGMGFDLSSLGGAANSLTGALKLATGGAGYFSTVLNGITTGWDAGGVSGALSGLGTGLSDAWSGLSAFQVGLGYAAAAVQGLFIVMDQNKTNLGKAIQTGILAAGVALAGFTSGISLVVAPLVNWILDLFGVFGKGPSSFDLKRIAAADEANQALGQVSGGYQAALNSGSRGQVLAALQAGGGGGAGNSVRTELVLPAALAGQIGLVGQQIGDKVVTQWSNVTLEQFDKVLAAFAATPALAENIRGSGDVPFLGQGDAEAVAEQIRQGAIALLNAFTALEGVRDQIDTWAETLAAAAQEALPPDLAQQFAESVVNPMRDRILSLLTAGLPAEELQKQVDVISKEVESKIKTWSGLAEAFKSFDIVGTLLPANLGEKFRAAMDPAYATLLETVKTGTAEQVTAQADAFKKSIEVWAAFVDVMKAKPLVESMLPADLQDQFSAAMTPRYDRILSLLESGNAELAASMLSTFAKLTQAWAAFGQVDTGRKQIELGLPSDLGAKFREQMDPQFADILTALKAGNAELAAALIATVSLLTQAWGKLGAAQARSIDVEASLLPSGLDDRFRASMARLFDPIMAALSDGQAELASALLTTVESLQAAWATMAELSAGSIDVNTLLPPNFAGEFRARMQPQWTAILATLESGNADLAAVLLTKLDRQLKAWATIGETLAAIPQEIADVTGELDDQIFAWQALKEQMDRTIANTGEAFRAALDSGDIERIAAAFAELHDATMANLQAQVRMAKQVEAALKAALDRAVPLVGIYAQIGQLAVSGSGDLGPITDLLSALGTMSSTAVTATQRLFAVDQGFKSLIATVSTAVARFGSMQTSASWLASGPQSMAQARGGVGGPSQISAQLLAAAMPFIQAQQAEIVAAPDDASRFAILQQQASDFNALAASALSAVSQWVAQATTGAQAAAAEWLEGRRRVTAATIASADREMAAIKQATELAERTRRDEISGLQSRLEGEQEIRRAQTETLQDQLSTAQDARRAQLEGLQDQLSVSRDLRREQLDLLRDQVSSAREMATALDSMAKFIASIKVGPLGAGNPQEKLVRAQDSLAAALKSYTVAPTAKGLTDLQGLAQTVLQLAEPIFSKPAPVFQALSATTVRQLEAAQALLDVQAEDADLLQEQLDALESIDRTATKAAEDQIAALRLIDRTATKAGQDQLDVLRLADRTATKAGQDQLAALKAIDDTTSQAAQDQLAVLSAIRDKAQADFDLDTTHIESVLRQQVVDLNAAGAAEAASINSQLSAALRANADQQRPILESQVAKLSDLDVSLGDILGEARAFAMELREFGDEARGFGNEARDFGNEARGFGNEARVFGASLLSTEGASQSLLGQIRDNTGNPLGGGTDTAPITTLLTQQVADARGFGSEARQFGLEARQFGNEARAFGQDLLSKEATSIDLLRQIKNAVRGLPQGTLASGSERVDPGIYKLHANEMVLPARLAQMVRDAGGFAALSRGIRSAADGAGLPLISYMPPPQARRAASQAETRVASTEREGQRDGGTLTININVTGDPGRPAEIAEAVVERLKPRVRQWMQDEARGPSTFRQIMVDTTRRR